MRMHELAKALREDGIATPVHQPQIWPIIGHLESQPRYPGHVKVYPQETGTECYDMAALLGAPGFLSYALTFATVMREYLEVDIPRLYSVNAFWTHPDGTQDIQDLQTFHRDGDDMNFVAMFIYGTDVLTPEDGPHKYQKRNGDVAEVYGPAGTVFIEDPRQQHMGGKPKTRKRLLMWARWGVSNPPRSYEWDKLAPVPKENVRDYPSDPWLRECIKLVAA